MVIFLYTDKNCEHQAICCIKSLSNKITDDVKIVYYTIGFDSSFEFRNLHKIKIPLKAQYPTFHYYKAELSLLTMELFPNEYYLFTDSDILFSKRLDFESLKHNLPYPKASYGPHEYPFIWQIKNGVKVIFDETKLMEYLNVNKRSQRYVWSCIYSFNNHCKNFFEEYASLCNYKYLMDKRYTYYPMHDETIFNVCLWKRNATENLGFAFVNTHFIETVKYVEESEVIDEYLGKNIDVYKSDWEYVENSANILAYHGFKEKNAMEETLNYLLK